MSDAAVATLVAGLITIATMVVGFLTLWVKLKYGEKKTDELTKQSQTVEAKVDANTALTRSGTSAATRSAEVAAATATGAAQTAAKTHAATEAIAVNIEKKLNGGLDVAIEKVVGPLRQSLVEHAVNDERNMRDIMSALEDIRKKLK